MAAQARPTTGQYAAKWPANPAYFTHSTRATWQAGTCTWLGPHTLTPNIVKCTDSRARMHDGRQVVGKRKVDREAGRGHAGTFSACAVCPTKAKAC